MNSLANLRLTRAIPNTFLLSAAIVLALGCKPAAETKPSGDADSSLGAGDETSSSSEAADTAAASDDSTTDPFGQSTANDFDSVDDADSGLADAADDADQPSQIVLGDDVLTAGIPGEGELTIEQIKAWVDDPSNHEVIDPILPLGLSAAQANVQGVAENPLTKAKIELGRQLYFDTRLSSDGTISCASCHHPDEGYGRRTQFGEGVDGQTGNRNSPVSYNRIVSGPQFWDGRAASLEEQAAGPIANPIEMGNTHEKAVDTVKSIDGYRLQFEKVFPGEDISIDTITQAIATFERALVSGPSPYDYFEKVRAVEESYADELDDLEDEDPELFKEYQFALEGSRKMSESAKRGRDLFFSDRVGCTACHAGANFTDEKYHNLGVGMDAEEPDLGRFAVTSNEADKGGFKTPTVRNVVHSAPYMHDGSQQTLEEVVEWYDKGGHANPHLSDKIKKINLTDQEEKDLVAFMVEALTGPFPVVEQGRLPQ